MVNIKINDVPISVEEGTTILEACREAKMIVPTLCYLKDINEIGACRVCVVEVKGIERLVTSCNHKVKEGMEIYTNTPKVRDARRINIKMILSQHNCFCPTCVRSGNCQLQKVANDLEFGSGTFKQHITEEKWPMDFPLIRDESKCIKCMRCIQICDKVQSLKVWDIAKTGSRTTVNVSFGRNIKEADCALCGQCITHCPVAALSGRDDKRPVFSQNGMLNTRRKTTVVQVAPAVRTAWAEAFRLSRKFASPERLAGALRLMGFDYVFDTTYAADLTIMEEGSEFLERLKHKEDYQWPMFTSCCPGWVRFLKSQYPDMVDCLSTAKSPQQMQGAIIKNYFADKINFPLYIIIGIPLSYSYPLFYQLFYFGGHNFISFTRQMYIISRIQAIPEFSICRQKPFVGIDISCFRERMSAQYMMYFITLSPNLTFQLFSGRQQSQKDNICVRKSLFCFPGYFYNTLCNFSRCIIS